LVPQSASEEQLVVVTPPVLSSTPPVLFSTPPVLSFVAPPVPPRPPVVWSLLTH
jgi:hypothetical protein